MQTGRTKPKCPNHDVPLTQCGFPLPMKGQGVCPVSGASFSFEADGEVEGEELKLDTQGNIIKTTQYKIIGSD